MADRILANDYVMKDGKWGINTNTLIIGSTGSGKSRSIVYPNLLHDDGKSKIIADPKGTAFINLAKSLKEQGYIIKVLDFVHPEKSMRWNPFVYMKNETDVLEFSHLVCNASGIDDSDPFWDLAAQDTLTSAILYLFEYYEKEEINMEMLLDLIQTYTNDNKKTNIAIHLFDDLKREKPKSPAIRYFETYKSSTDASNTCSGILSILNQKISMFKLSSIIKMMDLNDEMEIELLGTKKVALFITMKDYDSSLYPLASCFYSQCFSTLMRLADDEYNGCLPVPVTFWLEDFFSQVQLPSFTQKISTIRSRNIDVVMIGQSFAQIESLYKDKSNIIIDNCSYLIYLGCNNDETQQRIARKCNVPYDVIKNMKYDDCVVIAQGEEPFFAKKYDITIDDLYKNSGFENDKNRINEYLDIYKKREVNKGKQK